MFSIVENEQVVTGPVERVEVSSQHEASEELEETLAELGRGLAQIKPDLVVLLMPEQSRFKKTYHEIAPRVALETLVRLAAVRAEIPIEVLPRATVRARLKLPRNGDLASHVADRIPEPVGRHWTIGRDVAALAALAGEAGV